MAVVHVWILDNVGFICLKNRIEPPLLRMGCVTDCFSALVQLELSFMCTFDFFYKSSVLIWILSLVGYAAVCVGIHITVPTSEQRVSCSSAKLRNHLHDVVRSVLRLLNWCAMLLLDSQIFVSSFKMGYFSLAGCKIHCLAAFFVPLRTCSLNFRFWYLFARVSF